MLSAGLCLVSQSCLILCNFVDCSPPGSSVHGDSPGKNTVTPSSRDLPNLGIKLRSFTLQADSLPSEPRRKPMNTGVGSLSLLQGISMTQEANQGHLHCQQILNQLSYQGSPCVRYSALKRDLHPCKSVCFEKCG